MRCWKGKHVAMTTDSHTKTVPLREQFETELHTLIEEWIRRGVVPQNMVTAFGAEVTRMWELVREQKRARQ